MHGIRPIDSTQNPVKISAPHVIPFFTYDCYRPQKMRRTNRVVRLIMASSGLVPLREAVASVVPQDLAPSTIWRWCNRGFSNGDGTRIRLSVQYVGRSPCTTIEAVQHFIAEVTQARLARMARTQQRAADVTNEELAAVGLSGPRR